jgi:hypothetical protein
MLIQNFPPWFWSWLGPLVWPWSFWPTFSETLTSNDDKWEGYCLVQRIEPVRLSRSGARVKVTVRSAWNSYAWIQTVTISRPDPTGQPYDSAADLTFLAKQTFADSSYGIPAGESVTFGPVIYDLDEGQPLLIAVDFGPAPPAPTSAIMYTNTDAVPIEQACAYYNKGAWAAIKDRAATAAAQSLPEFTTYPGIFFVEKIEVSVGLTGGYP